MRAVKSLSYMIMVSSKLSQKLRMAQQSDPIRDLEPAGGNTDVDPSKTNNPRDLVKNSTILSAQGSLTLVPKQAVLHVPDRHQERLAVERGAKVITFQQFLARNRGWLRTVEVTRDQALGKEPFAEATLEAIKNSSSVVIATYQKGPISVLPQKDPEESPESSETEQATLAQ